MVSSRVSKRFPYHPPQVSFIFAFVCGGRFLAGGRGREPGIDNWVGSFPPFFCYLLIPPNSGNSGWIPAQIGANFVLSRPKMPQVKPVSAVPHGRPRMRRGSSWAGCISLAFRTYLMLLSYGEGNL